METTETAGEAAGESCAIGGVCPHHKPLWRAAWIVIGVVALLTVASLVYSAQVTASSAGTLPAAANSR